MTTNLPAYSLHVTDINTPYYCQWYLNKIKWMEAIIETNSIPKDPIIIAIIDNGIDTNLDEIAGKIVLNHSFVENEIYNDNIAKINFSHGTFLASIISSRIDSNTSIIGVTGNYPVYIMNLKTGDQYGIIEDLVAEAIYYAANHDAGVINLSLGNAKENTKIKAAIDYAVSKDIVVVAAAGNDGEESKIYPAAYENVISVSATDITDQLSIFSNYGNWVDVAAPGDGILGKSNQNTYRFMSGTSYAASIVSAQAAMIRSLNKKLSAKEVRQIIKKSTEKIIGTEDKQIKFGRINLLDSLLLAAKTKMEEQIDD